MAQALNVGVILRQQFFTIAGIRELLEACATPHNTVQFSGSLDRLCRSTIWE